MSRQDHPIWEEQLMPYVDGQVDAEKASDIAQHLETCQDCAAAVAEAKGLAGQMAEWKVEEPSEQMRERVVGELRLQSRDKRSRQRWAWWTRRRAWTFGLSGGFAVVVLVAVFVTPLIQTTFHEKKLSAALQQPISGAVVVPEEALKDLFELERQAGQQGQQDQDKQALQQGQQGQPVQRPPAKPFLQGSPESPFGPMIIRSARLTLVTKDFDGARARIEAIVQQSQGYLDQLTARGEVGSGRTLLAILRLPSSRTETGLSELRKLGKVREESQNSSDVTSQYVDLQARLNNARNTEQRLLTLQRERTGKLPDVVDVEREISRVREEIERMQARQKDMNNKVQFATIQVEVSEEYRAEVVPSTPSAGTRLHNAMVDGYHGATESVLGLALFVLRYGPALLLWSAVLLPVALLLRRRLNAARLS